MGSSNTNRQALSGSDTAALPTLWEVMQLAKNYAPHLSELEALRKYHADHVEMAKKTKSVELHHRVKIAAQLIPVVKELLTAVSKNIFIMN